MNSLKFALPVLATLFSPAAYAEGLQPGVPPVTYMPLAGNAVTSAPVNDMQSCLKLAEKLITIFGNRSPGICIDNATLDVFEIKRSGSSRTLTLVPFN